MKLTLRKKFVLIKTFLGDQCLRPSRWLGLLPLPPNPRVLGETGRQTEGIPGNIPDSPVFCPSFWNQL